jgi:hypothetical protein
MLDTAAISMVVGQPVQAAVTVHQLYTGVQYLQRNIHVALEWYATSLRCAGRSLAQGPATAPWRSHGDTGGRRIR